MTFDLLKHSRLIGFWTAYVNRLVNLFLLGCPAHTHREHSLSHRLCFLLVCFSSFLHFTLVHSFPNTTPSWTPSWSLSASVALKHTSPLSPFYLCGLAVWVLVPRCHPSAVTGTHSGPKVPLCKIWTALTFEGEKGGSVMTAAYHRD